MRLLNINIARSIWLFSVQDLNPQGSAIESDLIEWLAKTYHFKKYPSSALDFDAQTKTLSLKGGKFKSGLTDEGKERYVSVDLSIYTDGLVANTRSSTEDSDKFLEEAIHSAVNRFQLVFDHQLIRQKSYLSEMDVQLDRSISLLNPKLTELAATISSLQQDLNTITFEFSGVSFLPGPTAQTTVAAFSLERKINIPWSENRYFTKAPLHTHAHLQLLNDFESILIS